jgi:hypothetical protein
LVVAQPTEPGPRQAQRQRPTNGPISGLN